LLVEVGHEKCTERHVTADGRCRVSSDDDMMLDDVWIRHRQRYRTGRGLGNGVLYTT
jgi:hypothetical protein